MAVALTEAHSGSNFWAKTNIEKKKKKWKAENMYIYQQISLMNCEEKEKKGTAVC